MQTATKQTILSTQVILVEGHFYGILPNVSRSEPVFVAWCTPVAMPETRECVVQVALYLTFCNPLLQILQISYPCFSLCSYFCAIPMLSLCSHVVLQGATNIFTSVHSMDLKISQIDSK